MGQKPLEIERRALRAVPWSALRCADSSASFKRTLLRRFLLTGVQRSAVRR